MSSIIAILLAASALFAVNPQKIATASQPCWERDVFPILKRSCIGCHGQGSAMGNLSTPDSAQKHTGLIQQNLATGKMPMRGELSATDRSTLISWAAHGAASCP